MQLSVLYGPKDANKTATPACVAVGFFDGVHLGHRKVIENAIACAHRLNGSAWVLTFSVHPLQLLHPREIPDLLTSTRHKLRLLRKIGVDACLAMDFTPALAETTPADFVGQLQAGIPELRGISVGRNWKFGKNRGGNAEMLAELAADLNMQTSITDPVLWQNEPVSSTRIRSCVSAGNIQDAKAMLGRTFSILGKVEHGRGTGRKLGYPTANVAVEGEALPPHGVYAVRAEVDGTRYDGVVNVGMRPTYEGNNNGRNGLPSVELHLPNADADLYDRDVEVSFAFRLREERKFDSDIALKRQISTDIAKALSMLQNGSPE